MNGQQIGVSHRTCKTLVEDLHEVLAIGWQHDISHRIVGNLTPGE